MRANVFIVLNIMYDIDQNKAYVSHEESRWYTEYYMVISCGGNFRSAFVWLPSLICKLEWKQQSTQKVRRLKAHKEHR